MTIQYFIQNGEDIILVKEDENEIVEIKGRIQLEDLAELPERISALKEKYSS